MQPLLIVLLLGAAGPSPAALKILREHQCARCHQVEDVAPPPKELACAGCHIEISSSEGNPTRTAEGHEDYGEAWDRFVQRTGEHYCHVPALSSMGRFQASWLRQFLLAPYDVRPNLGESMIRHNLSDKEIETLIHGWGAHDTTNPERKASPERVAEGRRLFEEKGCVACHLFGNATFASVGELTRTFTPRNPLRALAPDLRHAKDRLSRSTLEQWILDPQSLKRDTPMPRPGVTPDEAKLIADFLFFGDPGRPATTAGHRPPPYDPKAPVPSYEEVDSKIFSVLCLHCHEEPHPDGGMMGDGGPGNTGGFGFKGAGLSFESYEDLMKGARDAHGKRQSVFRLGPTGEPILLERARLRYVENDRDFILPGHDLLLAPLAKRQHTPRGMPLGLPALTDEQFSLLECWVKGGHPGPTKHDKGP